MDIQFLQHWSTAGSSELSTAQLNAYKNSLSGKSLTALLKDHAEM